MPNPLVFLDGVTGYLGRWTLFWLLTELPDEHVAVLIRPTARGAGAAQDAGRRLTQVLDSIGMAGERQRVQAIPGDLGSPLFGNVEAVGTLRASVWMHLAGDVRFKRLGDQSSSVSNRDHTATFIDAARRARHTPGSVCHTSTFYTFEKAGGPEDVHTVPEEFHDPAQMEHHNAYGFSKLEAETLLHDQVRRGGLPFPLLVFRPDIIAHHTPAPEVMRRNPGLVVDDFRVVYGLLAALMGHADSKIPAGLSGAERSSARRYLPVDGETPLYTSDVESVTRAMAHLAILASADAVATDAGYRIFNLANRWQPLACAELRTICAELDPDATNAVHHVSPAEFRERVWPTLSRVERLYYTTFIEPFAGYLSRPHTIPITHNVDSLLGEDWHFLHPRHGLDVRSWFKQGVGRALEQQFGRTPGVGVS